MATSPNTNRTSWLWIINWVDMLPLIIHKPAQNSIPAKDRALLRISNFLNNVNVRRDTIAAVRRISSPNRNEKPSYCNKATICDTREPIYTS
ncbi:MAG TPA: hypothetical protein DHV69_02190 [Sphaerochaeta sp.]|nr:hypothetical protein [Sphaerochaeta sp.]